MYLSGTLLFLCGTTGTSDGKPPLRRVELWHAVAAALLTLLLIGSILIQQRR